MIAEGLPVLPVLVVVQRDILHATWYAGQVPSSWTKRYREKMYVTVDSYLDRVK
jgi:hypothetical protein